MYDEGGGDCLPPMTYSFWGAASGGVCCWGRAKIPPSTYSGWGSAACVFCCRGGTCLPPMRNSGFRTASAGVSCGNGVGGAGNKINAEDVLGCSAGVIAHS